MLIITAAVAVGLAVSLSPLPDLETWEADMRWLQGLLCSGVVLLVCELVRQVLLLGHQWRSAEPETKAALIIALFQRLVLTMLLSGLLILQLLLRRRVIEEVQRTEWTVYPELWPSLMLTISILAAIRILLVNREQQNISATRACITGSIIFTGLIGIAIFIFTVRFEHVAMAHFATNMVEMRSPIELQRTGFFPNHAAEGFRTFWLSAAAAIGMLLATGLLWLDVTVKQPLLRIVIRATFLLLLSCAAVYVYWFANYEFPRISPDIASVGSSRMWSDTVAWPVLLIGLATTFGLQLAFKRQGISDKVVELPSISAKGKLAVYLIAIASGVEANIRLCQFAVDETPRSLLSFFLWFLPRSWWSSWGNYIGTLGEAILQPEALLVMMLFVSTMSLVWQAIRNPNAEPSLQPVAGKQVLCYTLASLALLVVAIPTLAIFGFCYWLGPLVW
ncbi:MAG: hypothetical protein GXP24_02040 [Planctomycetes bacterium]|nr:hypothetical protein [Planctomycetota bacterium]